MLCGIIYGMCLCQTMDPQIKAENSLHPEAGLLRITTCNDIKNIFAFSLASVALVNHCINCT